MTHIYNHIRELIPSPATFIEIGAHTGVDTDRIIGLKDFKSYIAIEPDIRNFRKLKAKGHKLELHNCAVADYNGQATFHLSSGIHPTNNGLMTGANSLKEPTEFLRKRHGWIKFDNTVKVKVNTLDSIVGDRGIIDFIWCDAQGGEYNIIKGGQLTLAKTRYFYFEYSKDALYKDQKTLKECLAALPQPKNWEVVETYTTDVLIRNKSIK